MKVINPETNDGGNLGDYGNIRAFDPRAGRHDWSSNDAFLQLSINTAFWDNVIAVGFGGGGGGSGINVTGLYEKNAYGFYKYVSQIYAFELFAKTKEGNKFILDHAKKGFKLGGVFDKKLSINAKVDGVMYKKGINVNYIGSNKPIIRDGNLGYACTDNIENKKGALTYQITLGNREFNSSNGDNSQAYLLFTLEAVDDVSHETFLHGDIQEKNFLNGTNIVNNHSSQELSKYGGEGQGIEVGYSVSVLQQVQTLYYPKVAPHTVNWLLGEIIYRGLGYPRPGWTPKY